MNEKQVLNALSCLTNGALNYYQATQTVMVKDNLIRNYIELLQKQNTQLKEKIILLQASEPMLEFAKQTYKDNWNKLKEWLKEEIIKLELYKDNMDIDEYVDKKSLLKKVLEKLQEIEGGRNE